MPTKKIHTINPCKVNWQFFEVLKKNYAKVSMGTKTIESMRFLKSW
jgi:hypothetical protein